MDARLPRNATRCAGRGHTRPTRQRTNLTETDRKALRREIRGMEWDRRRVSHADGTYLVQHFATLSLPPSASTKYDFDGTSDRCGVLPVGSQRIPARQSTTLRFGLRGARLKTP